MPSKPCTMVGVIYWEAEAGPPPSDAHPEHPIVIVPPGAISPGVPTHPIVIPIPPSDAHPEHPIVIVPPDLVSPGVPAHPIVIPLPPDMPPSGAHPEHPIVIIPPDTVSPGVPAHPIVIPPPPDMTPDVPTSPGGIKPPPAQGGWGFHPIYGWGYFPGPGEPGPKT